MKTKKRCMMKKLLLLILVCFLFVITGCDITGGIVLPDLSGMSREEIKEIMEENKIQYMFYFEQTVIESEKDLNKFVSYGEGLKAGDQIKVDQLVRIYTTVLPLTKAYSPNLTLTTDYVGKSFLRDRIGEVSLKYVIDGDTAWFIDKITGESFKLRFLGIDTPETHAGEDPWGQAASDYVKTRLENATTIVIEGDRIIKDTYNRYLGYVWVDGVLLNLELIEEAYSNSTLSNAKYSEIFLQASIASQITGRRFFGSEIDPNYDYENHCFK